MGLHEPVHPTERGERCGQHLLGQHRRLVNDHQPRIDTLVPVDGHVAARQRIEPAALADEEARERVHLQPDLPLHLDSGLAGRGQHMRTGASDVVDADQGLEQRRLSRPSGTDQHRQP